MKSKQKCGADRLVRRMTKGGGGGASGADGGGLQWRRAEFQRGSALLLMLAEKVRLFERVSKCFTNHRARPRWRIRWWRCWGSGFQVSRWAARLGTITTSCGVTGHCPRYLLHDEAPAQEPPGIRHAAPEPSIDAARAPVPDPMAFV